MKIIVLIITTFALSIILISTLANPVFANSGSQLYGAVHQTWIEPSPNNPGAEFGNAIAVDGKTLVVGARHDNVVVGVDPVYYAGAVYVYVLDNHTWILQARLTPNDPEAGDLFGSSVAIDNDTIVVGAIGSDGKDDDGDYAAEMGTVYTFTRSGDQWQQQAVIQPADGLEEDYFGNAVAIVGERIVVGASGKDIGSTTDAGKVYSFYRSGTKWYPAQSITAPDPDKNDVFGSSLDLDGPRLVVGAPSENKIGAAYIYYRTGSTWTLESKIEPDDTHSGDYFGDSVSINDETVVVGVPFADPDLGAGQVTNAGAVYIFGKRANAWKQDAKLELEDASDFDNFGDSVTTNGKTIIVGATGRDYYGTLRVGSAYAFERNDGSWELQTQIISVEPYSESNFGSSVAIDGDLILIGESGNSSNAGATHIYSIQAGILPETGFAPGTAISPTHVRPQASQNVQSLQLEIPKISLHAKVVGILRQANTWNIEWLLNNVGYLEGTSYPTQLGNSVIAGHINLPDGTTGPFADIDQLKWGDQIIIHLDGYEYIYEVREVFQTSPNNLDILVRSDNYDWLTIITCKDYDPSTKSYDHRTVVVAVRIE